MRITITVIFLFLYLGVATIYDIKDYRVPNQLILLGLGTGLLYQFISIGPSGLSTWGSGVAIPFVLLFILYLFHMIGAGDIKLFSTIGGFLGIHQVIQVIILSFIIGAVLSAIQLIRFQSLSYRLHYLADYIHTLSQNKKITPYYNSKEDGRKMVIPFTLAITLSVIVMEIFKGEG